MRLRADALDVSAMPLSAFSSGRVTSVSTCSGASPGASVCTVTVRRHEFRQHVEAAVRREPAAIEQHHHRQRRDDAAMIDRERDQLAHQSSSAGAAAPAPRSSDSSSGAPRTTTRSPAFNRGRGIARGDPVIAIQR